MLLRNTTLCFTILLWNLATIPQAALALKHTFTAPSQESEGKAIIKITNQSMIESFRTFLTDEEVDLLHKKWNKKNGKPMKPREMVPTIATGASIILGVTLFAEQLGRLVASERILTAFEKDVGDPPEDCGKYHKDAEVKLTGVFKNRHYRPNVLSMADEIFHPLTEKIRPDSNEKLTLEENGQNYSVEYSLAWSGWTNRVLSYMHMIQKHGVEEMRQDRLASAKPVEDRWRGSCWVLCLLELEARTC